ncbi:hypothetical protein ACOME3_004797 [Neoechinorhynchus agilis]
MKDRRIHEIDEGERVGKLILFTFAKAYSQMKANKSTEHPVIVSGVQMTEHLVDFVVFQLNTLDSSVHIEKDVDPENVNYVWLDTNNYWFHNKPDMNDPNDDSLVLEPEIDNYIMNKMEYNPDTFQKFVRLYAHSGLQ